MGLEISRLTDKNADQFFVLMKKSYSTALGFTVKDEGLRWNLSDQFYPTLGLFQDGELVSSMRGEWVLSLSELQFKLEGKFPQAEPQFPSVFLTKAGTLPHLKKRGFNLILRYHFFKMAEFWNARYMFGTMVEGSPRVQSLIDMGYEFIKCEQKWNKMFVSTSDPMMACLDLQINSSKAYDYISTKVGLELSQCKMTFDYKNIKIDSKLPFQVPW